MAIYKCCKCDNHLRPQGPFNAILVSGGSRIRFKFDLEEPGMLEDLLHQHITRAMRRSSGRVLLNNTFELKSKVQMDGMSEMLSLDKLKFTVGGKPRMELTICCDSCGHCCTYER